MHSVQASGTAIQGSCRAGGRWASYLAPQSARGAAFQWAVISSMSAALNLAVCGLHLRGQPLNQQLTSLGASFVRACRSSPDYKFFAITDPGSGKTKPGDMHVVYQYPKHHPVLHA